MGGALKDFEDFGSEERAVLDRELNRAFLVLSKFCKHVLMSY